MSNHGVKWNETERTPVELRNIAAETREQRDAKMILFFLKIKPVGLLHRSELRKQWDREEADWARRQVPEQRFPWEPRTPGFTQEPEPEKPKWLQRALNPPWWLRFARRFVRNVTIAQSFGDEWHRGERRCVYCKGWNVNWNIVCTFCKCDVRTGYRYSNGRRTRP